MTSANYTPVETDYYAAYADDENAAISDRSAELVVIVAMLSVFALVGTVGNALVLSVYLPKRHKQTDTVFIIVLAVLDCFTCACVIPFTVYMEYNWMETSSDVICRGYHFLITSIIPFSVITMVAIAIDRYFSICHPLMRVITPARAKVTSVFAAVFAASLGAITACMYSVYHEAYHWSAASSPLDESYNATGAVAIAAASNQTTSETHDVMIVRAAGGDDSALVNYGVCMVSFRVFGVGFMRRYHLIYTSLYCVAIALMSLLYVLIYRSVHRYRKRRRTQQPSFLLTGASKTEKDVVMNDGTSSYSVCRGSDVAAGPNTANCSADDKDTCTAHAQKTCDIDDVSATTTTTYGSQRMRAANIKTAAMLFVVSVVFVVTYLPALVMSMTGRVYFVVFYLYFANNVANPIIYGVMNKNFRKIAFRVE